VLILAGPRNNDYTVLPVSSISITKNIDPEYDIKLDPAVYPLLGLKKVCYIRTHKQTTVHMSSLTSCMGNLKTNYESLYIEIMEKLEKFNQEVVDSAIT
jgi:uncharacterized protein YifN (PemK superfamily)